MAKRNPIKGPGKFEGELYITRYVYDEGFYDEELGDVGGFGWYGLIDGMNIKGRGLFYGIISENNFGFVSGQWFKDRKEMKNKWAEIEEAYSEFEEGEEEEEGD